MYNETKAILDDPKVSITNKLRKCFKVLGSSLDIMEHQLVIDKANEFIDYIDKKYEKLE